jgi:hypothetical protein
MNYFRAAKAILARLASFSAIGAFVLVIGAAFKVIQIVLDFPTYLQTVLAFLAWPYSLQVCIAVGMIAMLLGLAVATLVVKAEMDATSILVEQRQAEHQKKVASLFEKNNSSIKAISEILFARDTLMRFDEWAWSKLALRDAMFSMLQAAPNADSGSMLWKNQTRGGAANIELPDFLGELDDISDLRLLRQPIPEQAVMALTAPHDDKVGPEFQSSYRVFVFRCSQLSAVIAMIRGSLKARANTASFILKRDSL